MEKLTLAAARTIVDAALAHAREKKMKPLAVVVLDDRGALKAAAAEDGTSLKRSEIAHGKAFGGLALGIGSRSLNAMAIARPHFMAAATHAVGSLVPVPGGAIIKSANGSVIGAIGISGDTSDNDEAAAIEGVKAAGLTADPGSD